MHPKVIFKEAKEPKLGEAPGRHPLFRLRLSVTLLGALQKKYTSVMIHVCHSRSRFLSCMYIHDDFYDRIKIVIPVLS